MREAQRLIGRSIDPEQVAVGVFFFEPHVTDQCSTILEATLHEYELSLVTWRELPLDTDTLGAQARLMMPRILQAIITTQSPLDAKRFELQLDLLARKHFERRTHAAQIIALCTVDVPRTIVYKGLLLAPQLPAFYLDLADPDFAVSIAVVHQRYSTNTFPTWQRAQPFRMVCHNGEINTLQGNLAWMKAREPQLDLIGLEGQLRSFSTVLDTSGSDSAMLDNAVELLLRGGCDLPHAITMLLPPAWEKTPELPCGARLLSISRRDQRTVGRPRPRWSSPTARSSARRSIGNGLRPCRYFVTDDVPIGSGVRRCAYRHSQHHSRQAGPGQLHRRHGARHLQ